MNLAIAGHYRAGAIGREVLAAGGNAVDAGVAMGLALNVLESFQVQFSGVAPILVREAESGQTFAIAGLGPWPRATNPAVFAREHRGRIPHGVLRSVVPAAPDAWITALARFGRMGFAELAGPAIELAREGFPAHPLLALCSETFQRYLQRYEENARIWLPGGKPVAEGDRFVQADLAATLQFMADEEAAAGAKGGRQAGLAAARAAFYTGDIGRAIVRHVQEHGGWLAEADMAGYRSPVEPAVESRFHGHAVFSCGPWSQGPVLPAALNLLQGFDLPSLGHNTPAYVHLVIEAIKLVYADRERFYGDPVHVRVPLKHLLSAGYAAERRRLIDPDRARPGMPPPGEIFGYGGELPVPPAEPPARELALDTSVCCAIDREGNMFAATPSDMAIDAPAVPGLGLVPSTRGAQSYALAGHAAAIAPPGKRPRLTACPMLAIARDGTLVAGGGPGADSQPQAMLQVLLNHWVFGLDLQQAVTQPRFHSSSFPATPEPHLYFAGIVRLDEALAPDLAEHLNRLGHKATYRSGGSVEQAAVCVVARDAAGGGAQVGADPRLRSG